MSIPQTAVETKLSKPFINFVVDPFFGDTDPVFSLTSLNDYLAEEPSESDFIQDPTFPAERETVLAVQPLVVNDGLTWRERVELMRGTEAEQNGID